MKLFKTIYRYALAGLLLAAGVAWTVYCHLVVVQQQAFNRSTEFIDLALRSADKADALLRRVEQFQQLRTIGLIFSILMLVVLTLLIVWQVLSKRWEKAGKDPIADFTRKLQEKQNKQKQQKLAKKAAKAAEQAAAKRGFCPNCGTPYEEAVGFCINCGAPLAEK